ncbi:glycine cleavage system aminomethyltransferase T [Chitinispirillum alkaliphilum]|nr:glycine cleavage system aminomethyltransferase T [Chitinispirillum alkaliphilum]
MKRTILYPKHISLNAKMVPFGGYEMPIQYDGILKEHKAARTDSALFDTCHMGELIIEGENSVKDLESILSCGVASISKGACRYGFICNEQGGIIDDQILYRLDELKFMMVVNASTQQTDYEWIKSHCSAETKLKDISLETAKIDIQGPASAKLVSSILSLPIDSLRFYRFGHNYFKGEEVLISRTGYTGEIGFEIYCKNDSATAIWDNLISLGAVPAGLGARDTLRLEMGFPLYGHELRDDINAAESGFSRAVSSQKQFIGSEAIRNKENHKNTLVGIRLKEKRAAREGDEIEIDGVIRGFVTSGSYAPSLGCAVALGYVENPYCKPGTQLFLRGKKLNAEGIITELPFYKDGTARADLKSYL